MLTEFGARWKEWKAELRRDSKRNGREAVRQWEGLISDIPLPEGWGSTVGMVE